MRRAFDIGLIIPLKEEFKYIHEMVPIRETIPYEGTFFYRLEVGDANLVACIIGEMGPLPAAQAVSRMLMFAKVKLLVLIGVAGSLDDEVMIGDVVIADEINEFLAKSKVVPSADGFAFRYSGRHSKLTYAFREAVTHFDVSGGAALAEWHEQAKVDFEATPKTAAAPITRIPAEIHLGPIASGDIVASARAFVAELKSIDRKFVALDMEAAGVAKTAADRIEPVPVLVLRGISDFADEAKKLLDSHGGGAWRRYAIRNALRLLLSLLKWDGFVSCLRSMPEGSAVRDHTASETRKQVIDRLRNCVGGRWLVGVSLGLHGHAPILTRDGSARPIPVASLSTVDPTYAQLIASARTLISDIACSSADLSREVAALANSIRAHLLSPNVDAMLEQFDQVVACMFDPVQTDSGDELDRALATIDEMLAEHQIPAALESLKLFDSSDPRVRQRLADALFEGNDLVSVVQMLGDLDPLALDRRELEHLVVSLCRRNSFDRVIERLNAHDARFPDNAGVAFRQHIALQYPELEHHRGQGPDSP